MIRMAPASPLLLVVGMAFLSCSKQEAVPAAAPPAASPAVTGSISVGAPPASTAPAAAAAAPADARPAIATADGETSGVRVEVTELKRTSGGTVSLKFAMINDSAEAVSFGYTYVEPAHDNTDFGGIGGVHLIDPIGKKKYFVARDSESKCVCSQKIADIPKGGRANLWAKFPAPPDDVQQISIVIPHFSPMDDVPLGR
ncbi:MAG: hypothetical protein ACRD00_00795 [Thermoanaerobaculia bacterium]